MLIATVTPPSGSSNETAGGGSGCVNVVVMLT